MALVEFNRVSYSYGKGGPALREVTASLHARQLTCVLGANGSGKSTFGALANALIVPTEGTVTVNGMNTTAPGCTARIRSCVAAVFQDPDDQIVASIVADEVAFGPENLGLASCEVRRRVERSLAAVGLGGFERRPVDALSGGQKQRLAIAGALAMQPQAIVFDEAGSMLDPRGRRELRRIMRDLADGGLAIICITHSLDDAQVADRIIELADGRISYDGPAGDYVSARQAEERDALRHVSLRMSALVARTGGGANAAAPEPVIAFNDVGYSYGKPTRSNERPPALSGMSFGILHGEALGIAGHTGSGKSTLMQIAAGLLEPTHGNVTPPGRGAPRVAALFQRPERQLFAPTVHEDVAFGPRNLGLSEAEVEARVDRALESVGLDPAQVGGRSPFSLSGGEQRRVALAGVLALEPETLVLDEPFAGLDSLGRRLLRQIILDIRESGRTLALASHDIDELRLLCDRVIVLNEGALAGIGRPDQVLADKQAMARIGL